MAEEKKRYVYTVEYMTNWFGACVRQSDLVLVASSHAKALEYIKANPNYGGEASPSVRDQYWVVTQEALDDGEPRLVWRYNLAGDCTQTIDHVTPTKPCATCEGIGCTRCYESRGETGSSYHNDSCIDCPTCGGSRKVFVGESELLKAERGSENG